MLVNYRNEMMHDSTMQAYRQPTGAVPTGTVVTLRLRTRLQNISSVYVCFFSENARQDIMMISEDDCWRAEVKTPAAPQVCWYYFVISTDGRLVYYGTEGKRTGGIGCAYTEPPPAFQLTVYDASFATPAWLRKSVIYQIFPDRFKRSGEETVRLGLDYHRAKGRCVWEHKRWDELPLYRPLPGRQDYDPCDYFGGTLRGIEESLDYIKSLGVGVIYLNPIFEAASNHRYNTADYRKVDPVLGTEEDFKSLCDKASALGIRVILDGVFSHTGSDSVYFNREGAYQTTGAANSPDSPYYPWYTFERYPDKYRCWWGFASLPEVNEHDQSWQDEIIAGEDSVIRHWLRVGAAGYRLDVADELPDDVLALMRHAAKETKDDAAMVGEVWEDATTKSSYGVKRKYALGGMLDSVTNYPLRNALVDFLMGRMDAQELKHFFVDQAAAYPKPMYYALMNLLSSHDIARIRTALSTRIDPHTLTREQQATFRLSDEQNRKGAARQRLAAVLQFALPGVPCVYYGDETGMTGMLDPFNRGPFTRGDYDLTAHYQTLGALRNGSDAVKAGHAAFFSAGEACVGVLRYVTDGRDAFGQTAQNGIVFAAVNRLEKPVRVVFDFLGDNPLMPDAHKRTLRTQLNAAAVCRLTNRHFRLNDGLLELTLDGSDAVWLDIK